MKNKIHLFFLGPKITYVTKKLICLFDILDPEVYITMWNSWGELVKKSDAVQGTKIDHQFFLRRPGTNFTGGIK